MQCMGQCMSTLIYKNLLNTLTQQQFNILQILCTKFLEMVFEKKEEKLTNMIEKL